MRRVVDVREIGDMREIGEVRPWLLKRGAQSSPHFSQSFVARPFKRLPHKASRTKRRLRHTCGTSRRLEGAKPYGVGGSIGANE